ncbi:MAG TPA: hypothetical protein VJB62_02870, partial [Patescibacteria group bacterium]|nr:hypothetical protein [Patescibacteria group bacterium]
MKFNNKFIKHLGDICVKVFQIVFATLVVGMMIKNRFDPIIFSIGSVASLILLTAAILLYY